jgi:hypothetical protein
MDSAGSMADRLVGEVGSEEGSIGTAESIHSGLVVVGLVVHLAVVLAAWERRSVQGSGQVAAPMRLERHQATDRAMGEQWPVAERATQEPAEA